MAAEAGLGDEEEYVDALGVITALEKTCELETKLRQAVQATHPLTTTLDWDFNAADREREALLAIRCGAGGHRCSPSPSLARADSRRQPLARVASQALELSAALPPCRITPLRIMQRAAGVPGGQAEGVPLPGAV